MKIAIIIAAIIVAAAGEFYNAQKFPDPQLLDMMLTSKTTNGEML